MIIAAFCIKVFLKAKANPYYFDVYRTGFGDDFAFPKMDDLPPAAFNLSGFKIVNAAKEVKIVSYKADGPLFLYVTSVWAKGDNEWKTFFYQATKYK
jgi:hypothetical protein